VADATVVVTTRDRRVELLRALRSLAAQTAALEVIVIVDGSEPETAEAARAEFPQFSIELDRHRGYITQRNRGARRATAPIIVFLDDDAELPSPLTVEQTLADFDDAHIAAVGIPYLQPADGSRAHQLAPARPGHWLTDHFMGCASAVRRDAFLAVGGFDASLFMQGEEPDLCAKLLRRGLVTTLGRADPGIHHVSPRRQNELISRYATRNQMLVAMRYGTGTALAWQLMARSLFSAGRAWRSGYPRAVLAGAREGISLGRSQAQRNPLPPRLYRLLMQLEAERLSGVPLTRLEDVVDLLPRRRTVPSQVAAGPRPAQSEAAAASSASLPATSAPTG
jgi:GT2 family glycosyltransferase